MKKFTALLLCMLLLTAFTACKNENEPLNENSTNETSSSQEETLSNAPSPETGMKEKLDQMEYAVYRAVFYEDRADEYENKEYTKDGVFAVIKDEYNDITRYYVWGYADNTKCCDYQWELLLPEDAEIPESGSYVSVTGTLKYNEAALDKYRLENVSLTVESSFENAGFDYDLTTLSPTLCRVQIASIIYKKELSNAKTVRVLGRILTDNIIQHPYNDNSWSLHFIGLNSEVAIGSTVLLTGEFKAVDNGCVIEASSLTKIG